VNIDKDMKKKQKCWKKKSKKKVEKSREYKSVEHLVIGNKVAITFTIILKV
jgi:hypothetical protein